jgi:hypothetical protein
MEHQFNTHKTIREFYALTDYSTASSLTEEQAVYWLARWNNIPENDLRDVLAIKIPTQEIILS